LTDLTEVVSRLEQNGGRLVLNGGSIRYSVPSDIPELSNLLAELRRRREELAELLRQRASNSTTASYEAGGRFGQPHAKLFPYLGRKVRTPEGTGTLIQVFADHVTVVLDSQLSRCSFFGPGQIQPASWEM
jgi:hypothetical protein